ncbi:tetratricopeptide repeat protein [Nocardia sp. NPDC051990]|uniref:tetratricopeptide repeat protein n=1 Tax=Nocardia sp. NPDC051990 TaxID=3155285 RepID=UPI003448FD48
MLDAALIWLRVGKTLTTHGAWLGANLDQDGVRTGLERCYRDLARETGDMWARFELVDRAIAIRPRTNL